MKTSDVGTVGDCQQVHQITALMQTGLSLQDDLLKVTQRPVAVVSYLSMEGGIPDTHIFATDLPALLLLVQLFCHCIRFQTDDDIGLEYRLVLNHMAQSRFSP